MAPDDVFLLLINPPSKNKPVQKLKLQNTYSTAMTEEDH